MKSFIAGVIVTIMAEGVSENDIRQQQRHF
jgi:hypothetical protein